MNKNRNLRAIVCETVHKVITEQQSLNTLLPKISDQVAPIDRGLLQELVFGTCRWYFALEEIHNQFLKKRIHKNDLIVATLLKVGAYQLLFTRIPSHAAINETVDAAKQLQLSKFTGLINAVLRKISALPEQSSDELAAASHPKWIREKLQHNWPDNAPDILIQNNQHPPMTLRVNTQKTTRDEYLKRLEESEIEAEPSPFSPHGITLSSARNVQELPGFLDGVVSVQDEAAQLCCELMNLQAGQRVLDACAAPGGKTCAMLEAEPDITLTALDADAERTLRIKENLTRLNLEAETIVADATAIDAWWDQTGFDRILLDAPCSATGVIRRHPDIKLLRQENDIKQLAEVQLQLLHSLWSTLKEHGKLLYATCSIFPQENSRIIERFLKQEESARLEKIDAPWGIDTGFGRQLLPTRHGHDGFFYACLTKKSESDTTPS